MAYFSSFLLGRKWHLWKQYDFGNVGLDLRGEWWKKTSYPGGSQSMYGHNFSRHTLNEDFFHVKVTP